MAVNVGTRRSEFSYDGQQRRVRIVEKENSIVQLIRVWFARDPNVQYEAGKTLGQHEYEHVGDYQRACRAVESAQSEGFSSRAECERARTGWLNWVRQVFNDFDQLTGGRDK